MRALLKKAPLLTHIVPFTKQKPSTSDFINHDYQYLSLAVAEKILTITLNRTDKKNALSLAMMRELIDVAESLKHDKQVRAVIIKGAGDAFCAGIDLKDLNHSKNRAFAVWELIKPTQNLFQKVCLIWRDVPVPVISVLHGYCLGAGMQLALATDIRVAHPDCQLAIMEAKWGLVPDMGLTQSAVQLIRADVLKELTMSARMLDAAAGQPLGLVSHVTAEPEAMAQKLAAEFASRSPDAVLAGKRIINTMTKQTFSTLYQEKVWQMKLMLGRNRKLAIKKAKDDAVEFAKRQYD